MNDTLSCGRIGMNDTLYCAECCKTCSTVEETFDYGGTHCTNGKGGTHRTGHYVSDCCLGELKESDYVLAVFVNKGNQATFHHAAEDHRENSLAYNFERECMEIYENAEELREEMREAAKQFLWAIDFTRKADAIDGENDNPALQ